jgi:hypothetical protein
MRRRVRERGEQEEEGTVGKMGESGRLQLVVSVQQSQVTREDGFFWRQMDGVWVGKEREQEREGGSV